MATFRPQATDAPVLSLVRPAGVQQKGRGVEGASLSDLLRLAEFKARREDKDRAFQLQEQQVQRQERGQAQALREQRETMQLRDQLSRERSEEALEQQLAKERETISLRDELSGKRMEKEHQLALNRYQTQQNLRQEAQEKQNRYEVSLNNIEAFHELMKGKFSGMDEAEASEEMALLLESSPELQQAFETIPEAQIFASPQFYQTAEEERAAIIQKAMSQAEARAMAELAYYEGAGDTLVEQKKDMTRATIEAQQEAGNAFTVIEDPETGLAYVTPVTGGEMPEGARTQNLLSEGAAQNFASTLNQNKMAQVRATATAREKSEKQQLQQAQFQSNRNLLTQVADLASSINAEELPTGNIKKEILKETQLTESRLDDMTEQLYEQEIYRGMNNRPVTKPNGDPLSGPEAKQAMQETRTELNRIINKDPNKVTESEVRKAKNLWNVMLKLDSPELFTYMGQWDKPLKKNKLLWIDKLKKDTPMIFDYDQEFITGVGQ